MDRGTRRGQRPVARARDLRRDFAELTVANELDIVGVNPRARIKYGAGLLELFTSWRDLLSIPAWQDVQATLP